eukprot:426123-Amphidinium_carterae.1
MIGEEGFTGYMNIERERETNKQHPPLRIKQKTLHGKSEAPIGPKFLSVTSLHAMRVYMLYND